ncbi:MAG: permease, partial [Treponema sp.]|nr:permease [Treponema sp.]
ESFVPASNMAALFGRHQAFGYMMALSIGVPLFFCGGATIPLLMMWMASGMSFGTAVIFMITGQAMKIINLGALKIVLGARHFFLYLLFIVTFALLSGIIVDLF